MRERERERSSGIEELNQNHFIPVGHGLTLSRFFCPNRIPKMAGKFLVRVSLPMDVTAVLLCDKDMTVESLLNKALLQLQVRIEKREKKQGEQTLSL